MHNSSRIIGHRFGGLTTTIIEFDDVVYIEFRWHGEVFSMNSKTKKIKWRPIRPVEQLYCDFQNWLLDNRNKLKGMDTKDKLFEAWLAARKEGSYYESAIH